MTTDKDFLHLDKEYFDRNLKKDKCIKITKLHHEV